MKQNQKSGQAITEYLILTALIAVATMGIIQFVGSNIQRKFNQINGALIGQEAQTKGEKAHEKYWKTKDMGNFNDGVLYKSGEK